MATQLVDGVWLLDLGLVPPLRSNAYLIDDARLADGTADGHDVDGEHSDDGYLGADQAPDVTLCDTGLFVNRPTIRDELADAGYEPADLDRVLLTHYDLDHVGGLGQLLPGFDGPVYIGAPDYDIVDGGNDQPTVHHKSLFHRVTRRLFPLPTALDLRPVADGQRIGRFMAYATPGHNPGHVVYVHDAGVALLGDLVWEDDGVLTTPIRLDSYDLAELRESVRSLASRSGSFEVAAMGHGTPLTTGGDDALRALAEEL